MKVKFLVIVILILYFTSSKMVFGQSNIEDDHILKVRKDIQLLNLINGLELDKRQAEFILKKAKEAEEIRKNYNERIKEKEIEFVSDLQDLRENLFQGKVVSSDLKTKVQKGNELTKKLKDSYDTRINDLAVSIKNELYSHQLYSLQEYIPCLIPPETSSRIGQVKDSKGIEKLLDNYRNMPEPVFNKRKKIFVQRSIDIIRKHLPKGFIIEEEKEGNRISAVLEKARSLNDVDFSLKKTELTKSIISEYDLPQLPIDISIKIEKYFLSPEIVPLLQEKLF